MLSASATERALASFMTSDASAIFVASYARPAQPKRSQNQRLVCWQDRHVQWIAVLVSFGIPSFLGFLWNGWHGALGAFLIAGVARIVVLQHCTFLINSACHTIGRQPYSTRCSARDSFFLALLTMGEGYHNYHHEFQHDYRNGVKPWQFDPTKWLIWTLSKLRLVRNLRRVPADKIRAAQRETGERVACAPAGQTR